MEKITPKSQVTCINNSLHLRQHTINQDREINRNHQRRNIHMLDINLTWQLVNLLSSILKVRDLLVNSQIGLWVNSRTSGLCENLKIAGMWCFSPDLISKGRCRERCRWQSLTRRWWFRHCKQSQTSSRGCMPGSSLLCWHFGTSC